MDYGLLNTLGITLMALVGLWAFQYAHARIHKDNSKIKNRKGK